jgi:hypothetical protein
MISVVFSTRVDNPNHKEHIEKTSGIHKGLEVIQFINNGEFSLTELYNKALKETYSKHGSLNPVLNYQNNNVLTSKSKQNKKK